jgi:hypothetical protein
MMGLSLLGAAVAAALVQPPGAQALGVQQRHRGASRTQPAEAPAQQEEAALGGRLPIVHVQREFFEGFYEPPDGARLAQLGDLEQTNFSMGALYGAQVCVGRGWFVDKGMAPSGYCRHKNAKVDESIEGRWHPEFDEYALEKIMLGKWWESPARCQAMVCEEHAEMVVIPSPYMSVALQLGWKWKNMWTLGPDAFAKYWQLVQERYFKNGRTPLVVVHIPYCWAKADFLRTLLGQPKEFASRVVIAGIESNLRGPERDLFSKHWSPSAMQQLRRRARMRRDVGVAEAATIGEPLLFALPYPTSILGPSNFAQDDHEGSYNSKAKRKVEVSFTGNLSKSSSSNWIRTLMHGKISDAGGEPSGMMVNTSILCPGYKSWRPYCGMGLAMNMWDVLVGSTFCLEPPGDTPTRSHFYMAVQSGCVPVLFNGGHTDYQQDEPAWFAWRRAPTTDEEERHLLPGSIDDLFKDPNKIAVVYNSSDVNASSVDVIQELLDMSEKNPKRLQHLRHALDDTAPLMTFSKEAPGVWVPGCGAAVAGKKPRDAFEAFQGIMLWEAWQSHGGTCHTAPTINAAIKGDDIESLVAVSSPGVTLPGPHRSVLELVDTKGGSSQLLQLDDIEQL